LTGDRFAGLTQAASSRTFLSTIRNPAAFDTATEGVQRFRRDFLDTGAAGALSINPEHLVNRIHGASMFTFPFITEIDRRRGAYRSASDFPLRLQASRDPAFVSYALARGAVRSNEVQSNTPRAQAGRCVIESLRSTLGPV
jgi:hypothetical protein